MAAYGCQGSFPRSQAAPPKLLPEQRNMVLQIRVDKMAAQTCIKPRPRGWQPTSRVDAVRCFLAPSDRRKAS